MTEKLSKVEVSEAIDLIKSRNSDLTYLDACLEYAELNGIDALDIHKYINNTLYIKIKDESIKNNLLKVTRKSKSDLSDWLC